MLGRLPLSDHFLGHNGLTGTVPKALATGTALVRVQLNSNCLEGALHPGSFPNAAKLMLHSNRFKGNLNFASIVPRDTLTLHNNMFHGRVPQFNFAVNLQTAVLTLHGNGLSCPLPLTTNFRKDAETNEAD